MVIYYNLLNKDLKKALYAKSISVEDLRIIYEEMSKKQKKKQKVFNIVMIACVILFIGMSLLSYANNQDVGFLKMMLLMTVPMMAVIYVIVYLLQFGIIKMQFNKAIKVNYPEYVNDFKL